MESASQSPRAGASLLASSVGGGILPGWATYAVLGGAAALSTAVLLAAGAFTAALTLAFTVLVACVAIYAWSRAVEGPRRARDRVMTMAIAAAFGLAMIPLFSLIFEVAKRGIPGLSLEFFTSDARGVVGGGGAEHATGRRRRALTFFVDVMTGIPSIVAGLFAYALFEIFLGPGIRLGVMGSVALSVLMIPIVIRSAEEVLKIVPAHLREAAYALGTPKWKTITRIVLPTAFAGLVTGVMLAVARIIGETAPLLVTTGVIDSLNSDPFHGRMQNLAVYAYNEYRSPGLMKQASSHRAS